MAEEEKKTQRVIVAVDRKTLDKDALDAWRTPEKGFPILSFLHVYEACGISDLIRAYVAAHEESKDKITAFDNLSCNYFTLQWLRNMIEDNWCSYSVKITDDRTLSWDTHRYAAGEKHRRYNKPSTKKIERSIALDFANFAPQVDDDLEDYVLEFGVPADVTLDDPAVEKAPEGSEVIEKIEESANTSLTDE